MKKLAAATLLGLSSFLLVGCFDIEQTLTLERNLSGKAGFTMKVNMEPMADFMLLMQRQMEGKTGAPTQAEIDKARKDFAESGQGKDEMPSKEEFEKDKREMQSKLPKGVTLLDGGFTSTGPKMTLNFLFGFDNVSKLSQINFPKDDATAATAGAPGAMPGGMPVDSPFGNLKVTDEGGTILVINKPENPMADSPATEAGPPGQKPDPEMAKMMEGLTKSLRVAFKITSPMTIVEQNAHRKEGNTLIWEFDVKTFEKMTPAQLKEGVKVRYKK